MLKPVALCDDVQIFQNGKEALDALVHRKDQGERIPEVIFLDINMPIMDGWDFLDKVMTMDLGDKIIINMITSSIDPLDLKKWNEAKAKCPHILNFKNKPIFKIEPSDLDYIHLASWL